jgi:hypothetical protein
VQVPKRHRDCCGRPTRSWIALGAAPRIARCERKVCLSTCEPMVLSPARLQPNLRAASIADCVNGEPS